MRNKISLIMGLLIVVGALWSTNIEFQSAGNIEDFPQISKQTDNGIQGHLLKQITDKIEANITESKTNDGSIIEIEGTENLIIPNKPILPLKTYHIEISGNYQVSGIEITSGQINSARSERDLIAANPRVKWDGSKQNLKRNPDSQTYSSDSFFPGKWFNYNAGFNGKVTDVYIQLYPIQWNPITKELVFLDEFSFSIYGEEKKQPKPVKRSSNRTDAQHIMICTDDWISVVDSIATFHNEQGVETEVVSFEEICSNYEPVENPTQNGYANFTNTSIHNYNFDNVKRLIAYFRDTDEHPQLENITIVGSGEFVPPSYYFYFYNEYDGWIPSDIYYSSPDYDWSENYSLNRLTAHSIEDVSTYFHKMVQWTDELNGDWLTSATIGGGKPFDTDYYMGELINNQVVSDDLLDEFEIEKYQRHLNTFSKTPFVNHLKNDDFLLDLHICHGSGNAVFFDDNSYISQSEIYNFPQKSKLPIFLCIACMDGAFETHLYNGGFGLQSFAEGLMGSKGMGIAYIGGSRSNGGASEIVVENGNVRYIGMTDTFALLYYYLQAYREIENPSLGNVFKSAKDKFLQNPGITNLYDRAAYVRFISHGDAGLLIPQAPEENIETSIPQVYLRNSTTNTDEGFQILNLEIGGQILYDIGSIDDFDVVSVHINGAENTEFYTNVDNPFELTSSIGTNKYLNKFVNYEFKELWHYSQIVKPEYHLKTIDGLLNDWTEEETLAEDPADDIIPASFDLTSIAVAYEDICDFVYFSFPMNFSIDLEANLYRQYYAIAIDDEDYGFQNNITGNDNFPLDCFVGFENASINKMIVYNVTVNGENSIKTCDFWVMNEETGQWSISNYHEYFATDDAFEISMNKENINIEECKLALFSSVRLIAPDQEFGIFEDVIPSDENCPSEVLYGQENGFSISSYLQFDGSVNNDDETIAQIESIVARNYPNPFNPNTSIEYQIPKDSEIELSVYNLKGQKIINLVSEFKSAGKHFINWNGKDAKDKKVGSGIYFYKIITDENSQIFKMILLK